MGTNIYLSEKDDRPSVYGFRWCGKDCRWESRAVFNHDEANTLADHFMTTVEVVHGTHTRKYTPEE